MPLRALLNGESFYAWDLTEADRKRGFICPSCEADFIIVLPSSNIIKHFRHKSRASHDWKTESQTHLVMKRDLKKLADTYRYPCELEVKVSHGGNYRIADVLIKEKIVIECQCSRIPIKEYEDRTRFYQGHGYQLIWLLGAQKKTGLDLRIQQDYFDVFYYDEDSIHDLMGDRMSLEALIYLTSDPVLKEKREEQKRIEEQNRIERERWKKHLEEQELRMRSRLWRSVPERRFRSLRARGLSVPKRRFRSSYTRQPPHALSKEERSEKVKLWRENWGANGKFTKPIIPPRRMRARKEGVDILDKDQEG